MADTKSYATYDITDIVYGEYWELSLVFQDSNGDPIDVTGDRFYGEFRSGGDKSGTLIQKVDSDAMDGTIVVTDAVNGAFKIVLSHTNAKKFTQGSGVWDIWRIPVDGKNDLLIKGGFEVEEGSTNWATFV